MREYPRPYSNLCRLHETLESYQRLAATYPIGLFKC
jgi:hypothetical protein